MLRRIIAMGIPVWGLFLAGCSPLDLNGNWSWPGAKHESSTPARIAVVWTDTVLNEPGKVGIRGFGGRVMFYDERDDKPVVVEGTLTVYAFADDDADSTNAVPEKKFIFPADKLQRHYSESSIGHSYSFWLPWDEVGLRERQISLRTRFEAHSGRVGVGRPIRKTLPGPIESPDVSPAVAQAWPKAAGGSPTDKTVQPVSHHEIIEPLRIERRTVTIDVPKQFAGKYLAAPQHTTDEALPTTGAMVPAVTPLSEPTAVGPPTQNPSPTAPAPAQPAATEQQLQAAAPGTLLELEPPAHSAPGRSRAQTRAFVGPTRDRIRRQPHPATWLSALPSTPRSDPSSGAPDTTANAATGLPLVPDPPGSYSESLR